MSIPFIKKLRFSSNLIDIYDAEIAAVQQAYLFGKICPYFRVVHSELKRNSYIEDDVCMGRPLDKAQVMDADGRVKLFCKAGNNLVQTARFGVLCQNRIHVDDCAAAPARYYQ